MPADFKSAHTGALPRPAQEPLRGDRTNLGESGGAAVEGMKIEVSP